MESLLWRLNAFCRKNCSAEVRVKAMWQGAILAESDQTVLVEGNHYFPVESIKSEYFHPSESHTICGWKGVASYYDIQVNGQINHDAAWYYPTPKEAANQIKDHVAFWKGVQITS